MEGFVKAYRSMMEWEWYTNSHTKDLFLHCLLKANYSESKWQGQTLPAGSFVTSIDVLAKETGMSIQNIRTAKSNLQKTGELTSHSTNKYTIMHVENWQKYQGMETDDNKQTNKQLTSKLTNNQQTTNKQLTTDKELKELKNYKNKEKHKYGPLKNVLLTDDEYKRLAAKYPDIEAVIEWFSLYIKEKEYVSKEHNLSIQRWVVKAYRENNQIPVFAKTTNATIKKQYGER